eukprot:CAMPEP_0198726540 /NCGR_PEP_ID=MMETSP1475-20131203/3560_1 /TAXON_ID= ORGANISM="Unidentified sp., Strain CCMP1999" /NCGR_SAMPLE_ID=MMETSP1475 /ASSEMBLY_ACC=CAM_ASM_001111 /LENGTH=366 /DNA_ID=CAMNT_0044488467 /DNA_START=285 /DNA_END=1385 /DNA_ORIENTATION=+
MSVSGFVPCGGTNGVGKGRGGAAQCCMVSRRELFLGVGGALLAEGLAALNQRPAEGKVRIETTLWELGDTPVEDDIVDVMTLPASADRAIAVCGSGALLESFDGGVTWTKRDNIGTPLRSVRFKGSEGWIAGRKGTLLYSNNSGRTWRRVKLPEDFVGDLLLASPTGKTSVEILSTLGTTYKSADAGSSWKAVAKELQLISDNTVYTGRLHAVDRDTAGNYVGLPLRGSAVVSLKAGDTKWRRHERSDTSRPLNVGFAGSSAANGVWLSDRSGNLFMTGKKPDLGRLTFSPVRGLQTDGFGIFDMDYKDDDNAFAVIGAGQIFQSSDGGKTWFRDQFVKVPGTSLRRLRYPFAFGGEGLILRHMSA